MRKLEPEEVWLRQGRTKQQLDLIVHEGLDTQKALVERNKATAMALTLWLKSRLPLLRLRSPQPERLAPTPNCSPDLMALVLLAWWTPSNSAIIVSQEGHVENHLAASDQAASANWRAGDSAQNVVTTARFSHHADSTTKQYAGIYGKWRAWSRRQRWHTEYLDKSRRVGDNEDKILSFLGYLRWLRRTVATIKQAVFALKDAHKRAGKGDPTEGMYRLWMLLGAWRNTPPRSQGDWA